MKSFFIFSLLFALGDSTSEDKMLKILPIKDRQYSLKNSFSNHRRFKTLNHSTLSFSDWDMWRGLAAIVSIPNSQFTPIDIIALKNPVVFMVYTLKFVEKFPGNLSKGLVRDIGHAFKALGQGSNFGAIAMILRQLGKAAVASFMKLYHRVALADFPKYLLEANPCVWIPIFPLIKEKGISLITMVDLFMEVESNYPASSCTKQFTQGLLKHFKHYYPDHSKFIRAINSIKEEKRNNKLLRKALKSSARWGNLSYDGTKENLKIRRISRRHVTLDFYEAGKQKFRIREEWDGYFLEYTNRDFEQNAIDNHPRLLQKSTPYMIENNYRGRSEEALSKIVRMDGLYKEQEILRHLELKTETVPLLAAEGFYADFVQFSNFRKGEPKHCEALKYCNDVSPEHKFWDPVNKYLITAEDAYKNMCGSTMSLEERLLEYFYSYGGGILRHMMNWDLWPAPVLNVQHLRNLQMLGTFITNCIQYDYIKGVHDLFDMGFTLKEFLELDDNHFFITDSSPKMLVTLIQVVCASNEKDSDLLFQFWKRVMPVYHTYNSINKASFFDTLDINLFKGKAHDESEYENILLDMVVSLNYSMKDYPIQALVNNTH